MRHERIAEAKIATAVWPNSLEALVLPQAPANDLEARIAEAAPAGPTAAAPDVAAGVGTLIVAAYAGLILAFFAFFTGSFLALFAVSVATMFVAIFFAVPRIFFAVEPDASRRPSFSAFMHRGLDTPTGRCTGRDALVQMLIVPVLLTLGISAMGIIGMIYL